MSKIVVTKINNCFGGDHMKQLMFDKEFKDIIEDNRIWTNKEIPIYVKDFIKNKSDSKVIYDKKGHKYYCSKCLNEVSKNYYCNKCHKKVGNSKYSINDFFSVDNIYDEISNTKDFNYYVFDVQDDELLLYVIKESVYLCRTTHLTKISNICVDKALIVNSDSLIELLTNKKYSYHGLIEKKEYHDKLFNKCNLDNNYDLYDELYENLKNEAYDVVLCDIGYLYTDNLCELKNSIYKYTYIWDTIKYLNNHEVCLFEITCLPLTDLSFEYYVKYGLYTLAYNHNDLTFKDNFKATFGVDRKHLSFMVKNDINYYELTILSYINIENIKLLEKLAMFYDYIKELKLTYGININKLIEYFNKKHYKYDCLCEYLDYIRICNKLKYNLKDKQTIYPDNLLKIHNKVLKEYAITKDEIIVKNIINVSKILEINRYEDNDYVIYPAPSLESMIDESFNQNNCLKMYCEDYSNGETNIYFMRKKKDINKSLVTIEVRNNKVVQARIKNNKLPDSSLMNIINSWEKKLIPIELEN